VTKEQAVIGVIVGIASIIVYLWDKRRNGRHDTDPQDKGGWR